MAARACVFVIFVLAAALRAADTIAPGPPIEIPNTAQLALTPDGKLLISAHAPPAPEKPSIRIIETANRLTRTTIELPSPGTGLAATRTRLAVRVAGALRVYDLTDGKLFRSIEVDLRPEAAVALSPDDRCVVVVRRDQTLALYELATGELLRVFTGHNGPCSAARFTSDSTRLVTAGGDGNLRIWDVATARAIKTVKAADAAAIALLDDDRAAVLSTSKQLLLIDLSAGKVLSTHDLPEQRQPPSHATFSSDGRFLLTHAIDHSYTLRLWDVQTGHQLASARRLDQFPAIALSPDGRTAYTANAREITPWSLPADVAGARAANAARRAQLASTPPLLALANHDGGCFGAAFSPDGSLIATAEERSLRLFDAKSGKDLRRLPLEEREWQPHSLGFSSDGQYVLFGRYDAPALDAWEHAADKLVHLHSAGGERMHQATMRYSPDGRRILVTGVRIRAQRDDPGERTQVLRLHDADGKLLHELPLDHFYTAAAFSSDSTLIYLAGKDRVTIHSAQDLAVRGHIASHADGILALALSPDGQTLATSGGDKLVKLWDTRTKALIHSVPHPEIAYALCFSPNNRTLATGGLDEDVRIFDAASGKLLTTLYGHTEMIHSLSFSPDGQRLLSSSGDGTAHVWRAPQ